MQPTGIATVGVHPTVDGGHAVIVVDLRLGEVPAPGALLADWIAAGWTLGSIGSHGNGDRGVLVSLEQRSSTVAMQRAVINAEKSGKRHAVRARTMITPGVDEPGDWKQLDAWFAEGWDIADMTGNIEHGAWMVLERNAGADS